MIELRESLLADIQTKLRARWLKAKEAEINKKVGAVTLADFKGAGTAPPIGVLKNRTRERLNGEATSEFDNLWPQVAQNITSQYDTLYTAAETALLSRHPWLQSEGIAAQTPTLAYLFLRDTIKNMLFDVLEDKPPKVTKWDDILIDPQKPFQWKAIDPQYLALQVEGFPLSDPNFYNDRLLPSYVADPFSQSPQRYDLYRFLKKTYPTDFKTTKLDNGITCTTVAPLHISELQHLSPEEWDHLETIVLNIGTENDPEWVLLNKEEPTWVVTGGKKKENWVVYTPPFLESKCHQLAELTDFQIKPSVKHLSHPVYSTIVDWHAILLSRVLPWSRLPPADRPALEAFRSAVPIPVLLQNGLEASCLMAQKSVEMAAQTAFSKREPLSLLSANDLYAAACQAKPAATPYLFPHIPEAAAKDVLLALDRGEIQYDPTDNRITITNANQFDEGMKLAYFQHTHNLALSIPYQDIWRNWFAYNLDITHIMTPPGLDYSYAHACAARNRFLAQTNYKRTSRPIEANQQAWDKIGGYLYQFLKTESKPDRQRLIDIAEMGKEGLDALFGVLNQTPKPNLSCTLALDSGRTLAPHEYIAHLATHIQTCRKRLLFNQLDLILPDHLTADTQAALTHLMTILNDRAELTEVHLHNPSGITSEWLKQLKDVATTHPIQLEITIPEWDASVVHDTKSSLKASYRDIQNVIVGNIHDHRKTDLETNTLSIHHPKPVRHLQHTDSDAIDHTWRKGVHYSLISTGLGVQQQAQQEVAQEVAQEAAQQTEPKATEREIGIYDGNVDQLITRHNIGDRGRYVGDFSAWVGSKTDARYIIQAIDEAAFRKIQDFPSLFQFGIDWKHTPGFRLCHLSKEDETYVLTFDATLEAKDIEDQQADPFAIHMNYCKLPTSFHGDYRQLHSLARPGADPELTLWHHLATETLSKEIKDWLVARGCEAHTSETLQYQDVHKSQKKAAEHAVLLAMIKDWARATLALNGVVDVEQEAFLSAVFDTMQPQHLRAFGQLFYHYGAKGSEQWLYLQQQIYKTFPQHLPLYQRHLLSPVTDWSECLDKEEVDALTASMQKLAKHPIHQQILWELVDAHGNTVIAKQGDQITPMHYAEVWGAYNRLIDYLDTQHLTIKPDQFTAAISQYQGEFNASQFLRRIYEVMQQLSHTDDSHEVQQNILDNLASIDWHENGFYYACIYENYPFWDSALQLTDLQRLDNLSIPSYNITWDAHNLVIRDAVGFALRYAAQRLSLSKKDFENLKTTLSNIEALYPKQNVALFRLITTSLALGLDTSQSITAMPQEVWEKLSSPSARRILDHIQQHVHLDAKELHTYSYHVAMADLPILVEVLSEIDQAHLPALDLNFINAMGRALQAFTGDKKGQLHALIEYGKQNGFNHPLVTAFPWLVADSPIAFSVHDERTRFYEQLRTIQFAHPDLTLPNKDEITDLLVDMDTAEKRHAAVSRLLSQNCFIADQDADFRRLSSTEKSLLKGQHLSKTFGAQNRDLLAKLFDCLAVKEEGNVPEKIKTLLHLLASLDKKNYFDELGQVLGLLVEKSRDNHSYSLEQLTTWINTIFNENAFKTKPYPVYFLDALITDALEDPASSLINKDLRHLTMQEDALAPLQTILARLNLAPFSDRVKQTLVKSALQFKREAHLNQFVARLETMFTLQHHTEVTTALCEWITTQLKQNPDALLQNLPTLEKLALPSKSTDEDLQALWESNQIKLLEGLRKKTFAIENIQFLMNIENEPVRMILSSALSGTDDLVRIKMVQTQITNLPKHEVNALARYYCTEPRPSLAQLSALLGSKQPIADAISHFERVIQAAGKRTYSINEKEDKDLKDLARVLSGFKLKGQRHLHQSEQAGLLNLLYYLNTYSQVHALDQASDDELLNNIRINKTSDTDEAKARVLACMREMVLRKTGKWVNHTQMLDLLYATLHNDESLLHQIRTGEGKSIITLMRVAYRALNGQNVDVFSSKASLSVRDHREFSPVFDAFKISHNHITDKSKPTAYQTTLDEYGVGAVHYATIGNFSLFLSGLSWEDKADIDVHAENRVAFLDEGDHIMRFENTLFNYSDETESASVYNYDAWVYQVVYDFYLEHQARLSTQNYEIYEEPDLQLLYQALQTAALTIAPDKSTFFQKYLASGDTELRNQHLLKLLTASHKAQALEQGVDFCIMADQKKISDTVTLNTRFAKVMIDNQVYHGSTYSDLVQQFLHVRLNKLAIQNREQPNFFIDPETEVALSFNARYILKNYYHLLESCTGTPGNEEALAYYKREFGIDTVIKLPTHEAVKTTFLPPIYAPDETEQIAQIVASILDNPDQPILITCKDDKAVEHLGKMIKNALAGKRNLVLDTNATGLSEEAVVEHAGERGAITISSRMGRGTDIKPFDRELGLKVIRTYAAPPEIAKQEQGRQGRNAAGGVCQDIINYAPIQEEVTKLWEDVRFQELLKIESDHLKEKLIKHHGDNNQKWQEISTHPDTTKKQYLYTRTLQRYQHEREEAAKQRMRDRDDLISEGSGQVREHLYTLSRTQKRAFKDAWKLCKQTIEAGWAKDLDGQQSCAILNAFYDKHHIQRPKHRMLPQHQHRVLEGNAQATIESLVSFHQKWIISMQQYMHDLGPQRSTAVMQTLYGDQADDLDRLYQAFHQLNQEQVTTLRNLVTQHANCHGITCQTWIEAIELLAQDHDIAETYAPRVLEFFKRNPTPPKTPEGIKTFSKQFLAAVAGAPDIEFIQDIIRDVYMPSSHPALLAMVESWPRGVVDLCKNHMTQEDIVCLLNQISLSSAYEKRCIEYLTTHHKALKARPEMIRPCIDMLCQKHADLDLLDTLEYTSTNAALLHFFNQRPGYDRKDFHDMQTKVDRIVPQSDQLTCLAWLAEIPPYIPARSILNDLMELPGKHGGMQDLHRRIQRICSAATAFNEFLFDHDLIVNEDFYAAPSSDDAYETWLTLFSKLHSLDHREHFFIEIKKLNHLELEPLQKLALSYAENLSNKQLKTEIKALSSPSKTDTTVLTSEQRSSQRFFGGKFST